MRTLCLNPQPGFFSPMIGTKLAHYEITNHIGSSGMGDVYQATDTKLGRSVAIKFLPEASAAIPSVLRDSNRKPECWPRFQDHDHVIA